MKFQYSGLKQRKVHVPTLRRGNQGGSYPCIVRLIVSISSAESSILPAAAFSRAWVFVAGAAEDAGDAGLGEGPGDYDLRDAGLVLFGNRAKLFRVWR